MIGGLRRQFSVLSIGFLILKADLRHRLLIQGIHLILGWLCVRRILRGSVRRLNLIRASPPGCRPGRGCRHTCARCRAANCRTPAAHDRICLMQHMVQHLSLIHI